MRDKSLIFLVHFGLTDFVTPRSPMTLHLCLLSKQIDMKLIVGFIGVLLVLLAVLAAIGTLSYIGIAASLIILEVVPFLVLAVGVDNLFIIVHSYEVC